MSLTSGGTALNGLSAGGSALSSAGSAGISITLVSCHFPFPPPWCQVQTELERSLRLMTTPANP